MRLIFLLSLSLLLSGCAKVVTVAPGRGAEQEVGPVAVVYPSGEPAREARHGVWRGMTGDRRVWEVRYTRGVPVGPYREWSEDGQMTATWPYNRDGMIEGWARWFENGEPGLKMEISAEQGPAFDPIGDSVRLAEWVKSQATLSEDSSL